MYPSDLTDAEWEQARTISVPPDSPPIERRTLDAISYFFRTRIEWAFLPHDLGDWRRVKSTLSSWREAGVLDRLRDSAPKRFNEGTPNRAVPEKQTLRTALEESFVPMLDLHPLSDVAGLLFARRVAEAYCKLQLLESQCDLPSRDSLDDLIAAVARGPATLSEGSMDALRRVQREANAEIHVRDQRDDKISRRARATIETVIELVSEFYGPSMPREFARPINRFRSGERKYDPVMAEMFNYDAMKKALPWLVALMLSLAMFGERAPWVPAAIFVGMLVANRTRR